MNYLICSKLLLNISIRFSTSQQYVRYLDQTTFFAFASTAANFSILVIPSAPYSAEVFSSVSLLTAGNIARFTVVSRDVYGNKLANPALKSAFVLFHLSGRGGILPVAQSSEEVQYQVLSKFDIPLSILNLL